MCVHKKDFKVKLKGKSTIIYLEKGRKITISSELIFSPAGVCIYRDSIRQWDNSDALVSDKERYEIVNNIATDLIENGYRVEIG